MSATEQCSSMALNLISSSFLQLVSDYVLGRREKEGERNQDGEAVLQGTREQRMLDAVRPFVEEAIAGIVAEVSARFFLFRSWNVALFLISRIEENEEALHVRLELNDTRYNKSLFFVCLFCFWKVSQRTLIRVSFRREK